MPGRSNGFFDLDADVGLGYPTRRADNIKVQTILGNAGDLDLAKTDGPTGWGLYTLDDAIRSYQKRNDLKADGWLRPGGPTISKMRDQFGATLGKYPAPSPREVDEHHDRLAQGEKGLLNGSYGELKLAPIPGLSAPDDDMVGSNRSMAEYLQRHRSGLADAPATLASYVRTMGTPGIVQARDFVGQWDQTKPGQGGDAIRAILSALGDAPDLQRQFFGGPIANDHPIGIRMEDILMPSTVPRQRGEGPRIRDYRPDRDGIVTPMTRPAFDGTMGEIQPRASDAPFAPLPPMSRDGLLDPEYIKAFSERLEAKRAFEEQQRANVVYDDGLLDANNWPLHLRARLLGDTQASDETNQNFGGNDRLQPADAPEAADEEDAEPVQVAQAPDTESEQLAQASDAPPERNRAAAVPDLDGLVRQAQSSKRWFGESKECVGLVKKAATLGHTSTWRAGAALKATDDPPLKPGTAIATFRPDKNGDTRYPQERNEPGKPPIRRHAGIFLNYGTHEGRKGFWALDQFNNEKIGNAQKRFYPFERQPGERGYAGAEFSAIQSPAR
ncbi:MAG: BPSL0067 family protein [Alphaproteobacteria bacterium]|nr:BPSL0067 family protein [Alphaproteobacteria bacterium]